MEAARAVGATPAQQASCAAALCIGMAVTSFILSWRYRMPIITAWSTPGAALIATSAIGVRYPDALGAFLTAGLLMCLAAVIRPLSRAIEKIPVPVASAMLAGVLLRYTLNVPAAALELPFLVVPLVTAFFALRLAAPLFAVPAIVAGAILLSVFGGYLNSSCCSIALTPLSLTQPEFDPAVMLSLGVPLFIVTMASQNLPGFAVIRAAGYEPPVAPSLLVTGAASAILAPFGAHALNLAAITASLVTGPEAHPDPYRRWLVCWPYLVLYSVVGILAGSFVAVLGAIPVPLITAVAGLALFAPLLGAASAMMREPRDAETAIVTFLVTASGISLAGVGSAFWGLAAGLILFGARHLLGETRWR
jgi:benzoate membrane transport protein